MTYRNVILKSKTFNYLNECKEEYLFHHPEMEHIPISNDKIIYEMEKLWLKTNKSKWAYLFDDRGELR